VALPIVDADEHGSPGGVGDGDEASQHAQIQELGSRL